MSTNQTGGDPDPRFHIEGDAAVLETQLQKIERQQHEARERETTYAQAQFTINNQQLRVNTLLMVFTGLLLVTSILSGAIVIWEAHIAQQGAAAAQTSAKTAQDMFDAIAGPDGQFDRQMKQTIHQTAAQAQSAGAAEQAANAAKLAANTASAQLTVAQKQFEIAQRPWIQVSAIPTQFDWEIPDAKKGITTPGVKVGFQISAKNIGNLPAESVYFSLGAFEQFPSLNSQNPFAYLKKREMDGCAAVVKDVPGTPGRYYVAKDLYPNQPPEIIQRVGDYYLGGPHNGVIALSGCLIFRYQSSPQVHQRGFIFLLMKKGKDDTSMPSPFDQSVPVSQLVFVDYSGEAYSN